MQYVYEFLLMAITHCVVGQVYRGRVGLLKKYLNFFLKILSGVLKNVVILQPEKGSKCCLIYQ